MFTEWGSPMGYKSEQEQDHALVIGISSPSKSNHCSIKLLWINGHRITYI